MNRSLLAVVFLLVGCRSQVQHGLDERDANEIISVLTARGFDAQKVPEKGKKPTWAIEVDDARATDVLRVLTELKLPRPARTTTREVASQAALIDTPAAEKLRQLEAEEGDIEQSLETMDGVTSAAVELVVPVAPRPGQMPTPSKASVLLRVQPTALERLQQQRGELRALVAAAVDGLQSDDVVLVLDPVTMQVTAPVTQNDTGLRVLVGVFGSLTSLLAIGLVVLAMKQRHAVRAAPATTPAPAPAPPTTPKPQVSPAIQRKVA